MGGGQFGGMGGPMSGGQFGGMGMGGGMGGQFGGMGGPMGGPMGAPMGAPMGGMGGPMGGMNQGPKSTGNNNSVTFKKRLGNGMFGEVWLAEYEGKEVAAKTTECPTGFPANEIEILRKAQGNYSVKLIAEESLTPKGTCIVMELCQGSLEDKVKESARGTQRGPGGGMNETDFLRTMEQILEGLSDLHDRRGIIFCDLKPDNLLIQPTTGRVVFSDFGDARLSSKKNERCLDPHAIGWGNPNYHDKPGVMAMRLTEKSDMWMLAQTAAHMWSGSTPATNPVRLQNNIPMRQTLERCLNQAEAQRPAASQVLTEVRIMVADSQPQNQPQQRGQPTKANYQPQQDIPSKAKYQQAKQQPRAREATRATTASSVTHSYANVPRREREPYSAQQHAAEPADHTSTLYTKPTTNPARTAPTAGSNKLRAELTKPIQQSTKQQSRSNSAEARTPPRAFGQQINNNMESPPKGGSKSKSPTKNSKSKSPIQEVADIFKPRSPQPYGGMAVGQEKKKEKLERKTSQGENQPPSNHEAQNNGAAMENSAVKVNMTTFQDFNRRLDALKSKVMGDEEAWRNVNQDMNDTSTIA